MQTAGNNAEIYYNGNFTHSVDEKRRLQVPAKWRPETHDTQYALILWPHENVPQACIAVFPMPVWESMVAKLKAMPFLDPQAQALRRWFGKNSIMVTLDKTGRFVLPEEMAKAVGIENEVKFSGSVTYFELWSPERREQVGTDFNPLMMGVGAPII